MVAIVLLATLCFLMPEDGIQVGDQTLRLPTLSSILSDSTGRDSVVSPEILYQQQQAELLAREDSGYRAFFTTSSIRIRFPKDSIGMFDGVYQALDQAGKQSVRIMHYGDSQIEEDRISSVIRERFQQQFGGGGAGLQGYFPLYFSLTEQASGTESMPQYYVYGSKSLRRAGSNRYGVLGRVTVPQTASNILYQPKPGMPVRRCHTFNRVALLTRTTEPQNAKVNSRFVSLAPEEPMQINEVPVEDGSKTAMIAFSSLCDVYGVSLHTDTGVTVDNIPLRGCSGTIFTSMSGNQLKTYAQTMNVRLVILQFGGNSMPYLTAGEAVDNYMNSLSRQIKFLQQWMPGVEFLFVGPSDMTQRKKGIKRTYPVLAEVDRKLCAMAHSNGIAYWSMFEAMGGEGSMIRWAESTPALAGKDYVHFTREGAERVGSMLAESLMMGYKYYTWRKDNHQLLEECR